MNDNSQLIAMGARDRDHVAPIETREQAEQLLADLGLLERRQAEIDRNHKEQLDALNANRALLCGPIKDAVAQKLARLEEWADRNRNELLANGTKTARLATGELQWRSGRATLELDDEAATIAELRKRELDVFVVVEERVNRPGLIRLVEVDPKLAEKLKVRVEQTESFIAKPYIGLPQKKGAK